jgi:hypothetical protein
MVINGPSTVELLCAVLRIEKSEVLGLWIDKYVTVGECIPAGSFISEVECEGTGSLMYIQQLDTLL